MASSNTHYPPYGGTNSSSNAQPAFQANAYPAYGAQLNLNQQQQQQQYNDDGRLPASRSADHAAVTSSTSTYGNGNGNDTFDNNGGIDRSSRSRLVSDASANQTTYPQPAHPPSYANGNGNGYGGSYQQPPPPPLPVAASSGPAYPAYGENTGAVNGTGQEQPHHQFMHHGQHHHHPHQPIPPASEIGKGRAGFSLQDIQNLSPKAKKRLIFVAIIAVLALILIILFEVYKTDFERWVTPLRDWLKAREAWSWVIPTAILVILSFPPLFGHEVVLIVVGLAYPIGVAIGVACAGAVLGEALVFLVFKYALSGKVRRKCEQKVSWAAIARVSQEAGFKGVMIIRYSIVPPHLANPIFATTGMSFWLYMVSVILSLPKQIVFVVLGDPSNKGQTGPKVGKVIAVGVLVIVTLYGTRWIRGRLAIAKQEIEAERAADIAAKQHPLGNDTGLEPQQQQQQAPTTNANAVGKGLNRVPPPPPTFGQHRQGDEEMSAAERREWQQHMEMQSSQNQPQTQAQVGGYQYGATPYQAR